MKTTAEIQQELDVLRNELKAIDECRRRNDGLIDALQLKLLESQSPIYDNVSGRIRRIIGVDKKWIELKCDGKDTEASTKHNRETGWIMRARNDSGAIDVQKALDIWGGHLAKR